ncbi:MAG: class B sortase [Clostridiaceae bacterium]|nr:class B sortase [Clostridiaceae bacterium]
MDRERQKSAGSKVKKSLAIIRLLMACCLAGILVSGYYIVRQHREYETGNDRYQSLRQIARSAEKPPPSDQAVYVSAIDFESLREINGDIVAWLSSEGTVIDYPVVQGVDNAYYLDHLFTGESNRLGTLFLDFRNRSFENRVSAIYGHNMRDKSMLTSIAGFVDQAYYEAHPVMTLYTPAATYDVRLFAGVTVSGTSGDLRLSFSGDDDFLDYIRELEGRSTFTSSETVSLSDRILALVTCTYSFQNARFILFGKLVKTD